ncbi:MAG TPA: hypothetical protein VHG93_14970 [Longimicrobium sp.]|nr:hypothetical protein [Longimicrobium sp.]
MDITTHADKPAQDPSKPATPGQVAPLPRLITAQEAATRPWHSLLFRGFFGSGN